MFQINKQKIKNLKRTIPKITKKNKKNNIKEKSKEKLNDPTTPTN